MCRLQTGDWHEVLPVWLGLVCVALTTACAIGCVSSPTWGTAIDHPLDNSTMEVGLWQYCINQHCQYWDFKQLPGWWHSVLVLTTLSCTFLAASFALAHLLALCSSGSQIILQYVVACLLASFFCLLPAMILFGFKVSDVTLYLSSMPHLVTSWAYHLSYLTLAGLPASLMFYCLEAKRIRASKSAYFDLDEDHSNYDSKSDLIKD